MSKPLHPLALFRLMVLGPLASRGELKRGEAKAIIRELAASNYTIPNSRRTHLSEETITSWYHSWRRGGIEALNPKQRTDKGSTQLKRGLPHKLIIDNGPAYRSGSLQTICARLEIRLIYCRA